MRPKGIPLERIHYEASTNAALMESNRSFMRKHQFEYDWVSQVFQALSIPMLPAVKRYLVSREKKSSIYIVHFHKQ